MGTRRRLNASACVVFAIGALACSSCKHDEQLPAENRTKPPDHLVAGEAVEGKEQAFGLPLPRLARIAAHFEGTIDVYSALSPEDLVNFVRVRVKDGKVTPGSSSTILEDVAPLANPQRRVSVEVRAFRGDDSAVRSEMVVRDRTPVAAEPGLTDDQRWKKAGITSDGKVADPRHLQ